MAGFFSLGLVPMMTVAVPLWTLEIGAAPWLIGVALGARAALSVLFSIHGGALIDRLGTTRVMVGCSAVAAVLLPLYPLFPNIGYLILLQLIVGFVQGLAWMSAQTQIGLLSGGEPTFIGRFTFVSTLGNAAGPLAVGIAWDGWGPHGAFGVLGLWAAGALVSVLVLPARVHGRADAARKVHGSRCTAAIA